MFGISATLAGWRTRAGARVGLLRDSVQPWAVVPLSIAAATLLAGGFWLGGVIGGSGHDRATPVTSTVRLPGRVITIRGIRFVSTPARTVRVRGGAVRLPARTVPLPADTKLVPGQTVRLERTVPTTVSDTTVRTVTETITVTGPDTTVAGPTTTVRRTVTVPLVTTIAVTLP